ATGLNDPFAFPRGGNSNMLGVFAESRLSNRLGLCEVIGSTFRHGVHLAGSHNTPMEAARFRAGIPDDSPRTAPRVHHQIGAGAKFPPRKQSDYFRNGGFGFAPSPHR